MGMSGVGIGVSLGIGIGIGDDTSWMLGWILDGYDEDWVTFGFQFLQLNTIPRDSDETLIATSDETLITSRVVANSRVERMAKNGPRRSGELLRPTRRLVLPTQSRWVTGISKVATTLGHRVPNLKLVGLVKSIISSLQFCGRLHQGYYEEEKDKCFNCGQPGHMIRNCLVVEVISGENKGGSLDPREKFISYLKARSLISKECLYRLVWVKDSNSKGPSFHSVLVINEFPEVFPDDLSNVHGEIEFGIDLFLDTRPISISSYRMAPTKLKKLKEKLKDLVTKVSSILVCPFGYYKRFVEIFSTTATPLTMLTQKKVKFLWSDAYKGSFEKLNDKITSTPVLTLPEGTDGFVVYCDVSRVGLGCALIQHSKVLSMWSLSCVEEEKWEMVKDIHHLANLGVCLLDSEDGSVFVQIKGDIGEQKVMTFEIGGDSTLRYQGRLCIPDVDGLQERILAEAHELRYVVHPNSTKMYHDLKEIYWWNNIKRDVANFVARCMV
ncbi:hypothetical protein FXO38_07330 [Capsicum annuum]|nr:hypothetical protein FXO37_14131 [Capsicum annuum]KAF3669997.1 hypothetical protein FXO38_07330 [Capsicum annuum]